MSFLDGFLLPVVILEVFLLVFPVPLLMAWFFVVSVPWGVYPLAAVTSCSTLGYLDPMDPFACEFSLTLPENL